MSKSVHLLLVGMLILCFTGCSYTSVGDGLGIPSPDGKFRLSVGVDGAYRHAYVDKTKKQIGIWIGTGNPPNATALFEHIYNFVGSDIQWKTHWSSSEAVSVELYDWGDEVSNYNNMEHMTASNHIALLSFHFDKSTGRFQAETGDGL